MVKSEKLKRARDTQVNVRMTYAEKERILALAKRVGMGISEYLRHLLANLKS